MNAIAPIPSPTPGQVTSQVTSQIPSLIPENAPFSGEQRAWLNGFFAAYLGVSGAPNGDEAAEVAQDDPDEDQPWHDASLAMAERIALALDRKPQRQLMAAMAQLDCGQCGYLCQSYAEAVWSGAEADMGRCVPGGKETQRKLKEMMVVLEPQRDGAAIGAPTLKTTTLGTRDRPALATLVDAHPLNRPDSSKDVRHVVLDLSSTDLTYEAGDSLGVFARKNPQLVQAVLDRVGATGEEMVAFDGEALPLRQVLLSKVDIARPSDDCLLFLAERAFNGEDVLKLQAMARGEGPPELAEADLLDLLMAFPSVTPSLPGLLKSLDRLQPRLYSIASSSKAHPREVHLTVSAVRWDSNERQRHGIGSCYLADFAKPGDVIPVFVQKSHGFGPPADDTAAAIMIGPGTGIAPFRAFLEEREARGAASGKKGGKNWLFFGDQTRASDFLYEDQILDWQRQGVLHRLDLAFSRDQAEKIYVQHRMHENAAELWQWLEEGAHFYVCGDAKRMAKDVEDTLLAIAVEQGGKSSAQARTWLDGLTKAGRYQRDVY
ncbi:sulfite reductase subunit alpha [soil metagenome]